jgi:hypothetical protein
MLRQGTGLGFVVMREGELGGVRSGRGLSKMVVEKWAWGGFFGGRFVRRCVKLLVGRELSGMRKSGALCDNWGRDAVSCCGVGCWGE